MIPLTYVLEGDSLRVFIDGERMRYPTDSLITSLDVLEYFGALKKDAEGWLFIPDGSGALKRKRICPGGASGFTSSFLSRSICFCLLAIVT